jgi:putative nucleotidyltransferase with HDIG domain
VITLEDIVKKVENLPTLSASAARLSALLNDETSNAAQFEEIIRPDPALTANLLRITNSAYFGIKTEVTSVRQAVTLMGTKRLFELVTLAAFRSVVPARLPGYEMSATSFFRHSIAVAMLAEILAQELTLPDVDMVFTAGLLHDVGKLVVGTFLEKEAEQIKGCLKKGDAVFIVAEHEALGCNHAEIGADVATHWGLPNVLLAPIKLHHRPDDASENDQPCVDVVHIADCLAHTFGFGVDVGELSRRMEYSVIQRLGLSVGRMELIAALAQEKIREMSDLMVASSEGDV